MVEIIKTNGFSYSWNIQGLSPLKTFLLKEGNDVHMVEGAG